MFDSSLNTLPESSIQQGRSLNGQHALYPGSILLSNSYVRQLTKTYERSERNMEQWIENGKKNVLNISRRSVFRTLSNIEDGAFWENT